MSEFRGGFHPRSEKLFDPGYHLPGTADSLHSDRWFRGGERIQRTGTRPVFRKLHQQQRLHHDHGC